MTEFSVERLRDALTSDAELRYKLNGFHGRYRIVVDEVQADVVVDHGMITGVGPVSGEAELTLTVPAAVLADAALSKPVPGTEAAQLAASRGVTVAGDLFSAVAPYAGATSRVYELLRQLSGATENALPAGGETLFEETDMAVGRYVYVTVDGVRYRTYYEEAGTGDQVVLLQHTAGADGRQWRHQLADPEFQSRFRMIAYDLPFHGRSLPPTAQRWWQQAYRPTREWLMDFVEAFSDALELERPSFMGCSVGGQLALDLAAYRGERFGAFFALNGTLDNALDGDPYIAGFNDLCRDNRVSTELYATGNFGATSPLAPEPYRRELYWIYRSNFPGVYAGDNDYFLTGHNLTRGDVVIDTDRNPVYVLAGEYDPVATDAEHGGSAVAKRFPGVVYQELENLGHFAPTDDPLGFRAVLPALTEGIGRLGAAAL
ncbi:alpha/beta fold hydrolase [Nocardia anaemiae]|uniref:alpha/beta fold hydrolase n=1 Tax=Nocardia anaemiae TaxID=263910 RepID=UPI0009FBE03E|nr:alpha/beta hydrolase [Nocardia anaemiae]